MEKEIDFDELILTLFNNPPKPPYTFGVSFINKDNNTNLKEIFENLLILFTEGMKILFGSQGKVNLELLSDDDIKLFNKYMESIGLKLIIDIHIKEDGTIYDYNRYKYTNLNITTNTKLNEFKLPFLTKNIVYIISFDFL
uniref:Uncharacterized protein n=1 Tax=Mimiviridae sp. ChoanoV1 TaxID=2596887 RepID=A0A5B8IH18_9VIRU|nr:hypothetical protein 10_8 [Mimiviridae sp. ChoanoV1]